MKILVFILAIFEKKGERGEEEEREKSKLEFLFILLDFEGKRSVFFFLCVLLFRKREVPSAEREVSEQAIERVALGF